jgi:hypothetical protein
MAGMAVEWAGRRLTARKRTLPDFLIIGGQRCGTTSLYTYLSQHPEVEPAFIKEPHFFDRSYRRGEDWYRTFFPLQSQVSADGKSISGEATPYYLFDRYVPERVGKLLPHVKMIILLRNPVDRAYSHYNFIRRTGGEELDFEGAVNRELAEFPAEEAMVLQDPNYKSDLYSRYSYLARGVYLPQIQRWREVYPEDQFLILKSENLYKKTGETLRKVFEFLGIPDASIADRKSYNASEYSAMPDHLRAQLGAYFAPHNHQLYEYLDRDFNWEKIGSEI